MGRGAGATQTRARFHLAARVLSVVPPSAAGAALARMLGDDAVALQQRALQQRAHRGAAIARGGVQWELSEGSLRRVHKHLPLTPLTAQDPFLNAALTGPYVRGVQSNNISACVKHWIFNSQETNRSGMSSDVDERVGRELYAPPYAAAVDAGVGSVMCSFNRINGTWSCANGASLNGWLKEDMGLCVRGA